MVSGPTSLSHTLPPAVMLMLSDLMTGEADQFRACRMEDVFPSAILSADDGPCRASQLADVRHVWGSQIGLLECARRGYASHLICSPMVSLSPHVSCFYLNIIY